MTERLATARSGALTAYFGDIAIHSVYDPENEADRYVRALEIEKPPKIFILVEPGLAYLTKSLKKRFLQSKVISLHCSSFFTKDVCVAGSDVSWRPGTKSDLNRFLEQEIVDQEALSARIIEWRPSATAYGEAFKEILEKAVTFLKRASANERTVRFFGRRWFRNAFRYFEIVENPSILVPGDAPAIVVGAGPGLEDSAKAIEISQKRNHASIIAVSSAVPALLARNISPDFVMATDGGTWARLHLFEASRAALPVVSSVIASIPSSLAQRPTIAICDGSHWQRLILATLGIPALIAPHRGTVTATAIDFALAATTGTVYVTGMDLSHRDIATHARPYAFDRFREESANRMNPEYSEAFKRFKEVDSSSAFNVYASWFAEYFREKQRKIVALGGAGETVASLQRVEEVQNEGNTRPHFLVKTESSLPTKRRGSAAFQALISTLENEKEQIAGARPITEELHDLLVGSSQAHSYFDVKRAIIDTVGNMLDRWR